MFWFCFSFESGIGVSMCVCVCSMILIDEIQQSAITARTSTKTNATEHFQDVCGFEIDVCGISLYAVCIRIHTSYIRIAWHANYRACHTLENLSLILLHIDFFFNSKQHTTIDVLTTMMMMMAHQRRKANEDNDLHDETLSIYTHIVCNGWWSCHPISDASTHICRETFNTHRWRTLNCTLCELLRYIKRYADDSPWHHINPDLICFRRK